MTLTNTQITRLPEIRQKMQEIDLNQDAPPSLWGSVNCVKASGATVPDSTIKLLILMRRGDIDYDDYLDFGLHFQSTDL